MVKFLPKPYWLKVFFSNRYVYANVVRKDSGRVILSASTNERDIRMSLKDTVKSDKAACGIVGALLAKRCKTKEIPALHYQFEEIRYHGKLKTLLDTVVKNGVRILQEKK